MRPSPKWANYVFLIVASAKVVCTGDILRTHQQRAAQPYEPFQTSPSFYYHYQQHRGRPAQQIHIEFPQQTKTSSTARPLNKFTTRAPDQPNTTPPPYVEYPADDEELGKNTSNKLYFEDHKGNDTHREHHYKHVTVNHYYYNATNVSDDATKGKDVKHHYDYNEYKHDHRNKTDGDPNTKHHYYYNEYKHDHRNKTDEDPNTKHHYYYNEYKHDHRNKTDVDPDTKHHYYYNEYKHDHRNRTDGDPNTKHHYYHNEYKHDHRNKTEEDPSTKHHYYYKEYKHDHRNKTEEDPNANKSAHYYYDEYKHDHRNKTGEDPKHHYYYNEYKHDHRNKSDGDLNTKHHYYYNEYKHDHRNKTEEDPNAKSAHYYYDEYKHDHRNKTGGDPKHHHYYHEYQHDHRNKTEGDPTTGHYYYNEYKHDHRTKTEGDSSIHHHDYNEYNHRNQTGVPNVQHYYNDPRNRKKENVKHYYSSNYRNPSSTPKVKHSHSDREKDSTDYYEGVSEDEPKKDPPITDAQGIEDYEYVTSNPKPIVKHHHYLKEYHYKNGRLISNTTSAEPPRSYSGSEPYQSPKLERFVGFPIFVKEPSHDKRFGYLGGPGYPYFDGVNRKIPHGSTGYYLVDPLGRLPTLKIHASILGSAPERTSRRVHGYVVGNPETVAYHHVTRVQPIRRRAVKPQQTDSYLLR